MLDTLHEIDRLTVDNARLRSEVARLTAREKAAWKRLGEWRKTDEMDGSIEAVCEAQDILAGEEVRRCDAAADTDADHQFGGSSRNNCGDTDPPDSAKKGGTGIKPNNFNPRGPEVKIGAAGERATE